MSFVNYFIFVFAIYIFSCYINFIYFLDKYRYWVYHNTGDTHKYDYIIGAGSAGSILATELTAAGYSILLVEAGGSAPPFTDIPLIAPLLQGTPYDWQYITVSQTDACKALINNQSRWPMGKMLGGTSHLNYMTYVLGHYNDYKYWFPEFNEIASTNNLSLSIEDIKWHTDVTDVILKAVSEMNQQVGNINRNMDTGFMKVQLTMENGKRWSPDKLLYTIPNHLLTIITHAHVNKVLVESHKATGIEYTKLNNTFVVSANKGVILSTGVIGSPKLLMLSGIGPKKHLESLNIDVINDLPVGKYLVDHVITGIDLVTVNVSLPLGSDIFNARSAFEYFIFGQGLWTHSGIEALGTFYSSLQKDESLPPDIQFMVLPNSISKDYGLVLKNAMGISDKVYREYFAPLINKNALSIAPVLLHPKSFGEVKLRSSNPNDEPLIDPKYLSNKDDISTLIEGIYFIKRLIKTDAMKTINASLYEKTFPGCEEKVFDSREYWECYIRHLTLTSYHPAGTCRTGDVVDASFKVHNTENLYVVDASVFPSLPSGNINAAVMTLARKAAGIFKNERIQEISDIHKCYKSNQFYYAYNICDNTCTTIKQ